MRIRTIKLALRRMLNLLTWDIEFINNPLLVDKNRGHIDTGDLKNNGSPGFNIWNKI